MEAAGGAGAPAKEKKNSAQRRLFIPVSKEPNLPVPNPENCQRVLNSPLDALAVSFHPRGGRALPHSFSYIPGTLLRLPLEVPGREERMGCLGWGGLPEERVGGGGRCVSDPKRLKLPSEWEEPGVESPRRDSTEGRIGWDGSGREKDWGTGTGARGRLRLGV